MGSTHIVGAAAEDGAKGTDVHEQFCNDKSTLRGSRTGKLGRWQAMARLARTRDTDAAASSGGFVHFELSYQCWFRGHAGEELQWREQDWRGSERSCWLLGRWAWTFPSEAACTSLQRVAADARTRVRCSTPGWARVLAFYPRLFRPRGGQAGCTGWQPHRGGDCPPAHPLSRGEESRRGREAVFLDDAGKCAVDGTRACVSLDTRRGGERARRAGARGCTCWNLQTKS